MKWFLWMLSVFVVFIVVSMSVEVMLICMLVFMNFV